MSPLAGVFNYQCKAIFVSLPISIKTDHVLSGILHQPGSQNKDEME